MTNRVEEAERRLWRVLGALLPPAWAAAGRYEAIGLIALDDSEGTLRALWDSREKYEKYGPALELAWEAVGEPCVRHELIVVKGELLAEVIQRREDDPFVELGAAAQTIVKDLDVMRARRSNGCPRGS